MHVGAGRGGARLLVALSRLTGVALSIIIIVFGFTHVNIYLAHFFRSGLFSPLRCDLCYVRLGFVGWQQLAVCVYVAGAEACCMQ